MKQHILRNKQLLLILADDTTVTNASGIQKAPCTFQDSSLAFHCDWNWLVVVLQNIERLIKADDCLLVLIEDDADLYWDEDDTLKFGTNLLHTYASVLHFVEAYIETIRYPFEEGDDYWTIESTGVTWSCWDDQSQLFHMADPSRTYYETEEEAARAHNKLQRESEENTKNTPTIQLW